MKPLKDFFKNIDSKIEKIQMEKDVVLLANVRPPRGYTNPLQLQSDPAEYFSAEEFNEVYKGIVNAGFFIRKIFFNELEFLTDILDNLQEYKNSIIYNLFQNGVGSSKKHLVPAICDMVHIPYITSSGFELSLCRNKFFCSKILPEHYTPNSWYYLGYSKWYNDISPFSMQKVIAKPNNASSSIGISEKNVFTYSNEQDSILNEIYENLHQTNLIVQEFIEGIECEVPIICYGEEVYAFPPTGIDFNGDNCKENILTYDISTQNAYGFFDLSKVISRETIHEISTMATHAFRCLNLQNYARIDFRVNEDNIPYITDVNATPYTTRHSSFAYQMLNLGESYESIYKYIIYNAFQNY